MKIYIFLLTFLTLVYYNESKLNENELKHLADYLDKVKEEECFNEVDFSPCNNTKYPLEEINKLVKQYKGIIPVSGNIIEPLKPPSVFRMPKMENLCDVREETIFPEVLNNIWGESKIIVNVKGYHQGFTCEKCVSQGKPCIEKEYLSKDTSTECVQQYNKIRMIAVDISGVKLVQDYFHVPSGCCCKKRLLNF